MKECELSWLFVLFVCVGPVMDGYPVRDASRLLPNDKDRLQHPCDPEQEEMGIEMGILLFYYILYNRYFCKTAHFY